MGDTRSKRIQSLMTTKTPIDPYTHQAIDRIGEVPLCRVDKKSMLVICDRMRSGYLAGIAKVVVASIVAVLIVIGAAVIITVEFGAGGFPFPIFAPVFFPPIAVLIGVALAKVLKIRKPR